MVAAMASKAAAVIVMLDHARPIKARGRCSYPATLDQSATGMALNSP
jgi:hypothetical protein